MRSSCVVVLVALAGCTPAEVDPEASEKCTEFIEAWCDYDVNVCQRTEKSFLECKDELACQFDCDADDMIIGSRFDECIDDIPRGECDNLYPTSCTESVPNNTGNGNCG